MRRLARPSMFLLPPDFNPFSSLRDRGWNTKANLSNSQRHQRKNKEYTFMKEITNIDSQSFGEIYKNYRSGEINLADPK
jgi:hypothetical protein